MHNVCGICSHKNLIILSIVKLRRDISIFEILTVVVHTTFLRTIHDYLSLGELNNFINC